MTTLTELKNRRAFYRDVPWWTFDKDRLTVARRELGEIQTLIDGIERRVLRPLSLEEKITRTHQRQAEIKHRKTRIMTDDRGLDRLLTELDLRTEVQGGTSETGMEAQINAGPGAELSGSPRTAFLGKGRIIMNEKCKRVMKWVVLTALLFSLGVATATLFAGCNTVSGFGVDLTRGAEGLSIDPAVRRARPLR